MSSTFRPFREVAFPIQGGGANARLRQGLIRESVVGRFSRTSKSCRPRWARSRGERVQDSTCRTEKYPATLVDVSAATCSAG